MATAGRTWEASAVVPRLRLVLALVALLVLGWGLRTLWLGGVFRSLEPHFEGRCITVAGVPGPEDLTLHPERQVAYVSSYDRAAVERGEPGAGALYAYGLDRTPAPLVNLTPDEHADFRPHGLSLWRGEDGREHLFVIDHSGGEHSVRIYGIFDDRLDLLATVRDPLLVAPNDLVAVGPDRFYVTNDHRYTEGLARTLEDWLQLPFANLLYWDGETMTEAAAGLSFPNGINASADGRTLYVASTLGRELRVYSRDPESGALEPRETVALGTGPDNIEVDAEGALWIGAHPKLLQLSRYASGRERYAPAQVLRLTQKVDEWQVEEIYLDTGEALSASSVAAVHDGRLLIGALRGDRFLDCKLRAF